MKIAVALIAPASVLLASCTSQENAPDPQPQPTETSAEGTETGEAELALEKFGGTAWRAISEDGARYTTYLDPDGTYRDLRNGDPYQQGSWLHDPEGDGRVCLTPDDENGVQKCWQPGRLVDGVLPMTSDTDRRIELERVDYVAPETGEDEAE